jgi:hypothetical protein
MPNEPPPSDPLTLPPEAVRALAGGNKVEAIKIVRAAHKVDLKTARGVVDAYVELHPDIKAQVEAQRRPRQGWVVWLIVAAMIVWLVFRWV